MKLNKISCKNLWQFKGNWDFSFSEINFVKGRNGIGKSNMAINTLFFILFGDTRSYKLTDLPTKGVKNEETWGSIEIEHDNDVYYIKREIPTNIIILKNGQTIDPDDKLSITDKQNFLINLFKTIDYFKQFRLIDSYDQTGKTNFLEKSDITIKKVLFSNTESKLNEVRQNLLGIKTNRDRYNKDEAVLYNCFPSMKRLNILKKFRDEIDDKMELIDNVIDKYEDGYRSKSNKKSELEGSKKWITDYKRKIESYNVCPTCHQQVTKEIKESLLADKIKQLENIAIQVIDLIEEVKEYNKKLTIQRDKRDTLYDKKSELGELIMKLKFRLHSKQYKFTTRDVVIVKESIKHLDIISSKILKNNVKVLEPIINDVLKPIQHTINFNINEKGKFKMELTDNQNNIWSYKQLSTGQKTMTQIAIKLSILLEQGQEGLIMADEGMSSLDHTNLMHIIEIFNSLPFQLVFILHGLNNVPNNVNVIDLDYEFKRRDNETKEKSGEKTASISKTTKAKEIKTKKHSTRKTRVSKKNT